MTTKSKLIDRLRVVGSVEEMKEIAIERLKRLKQDDRTFLEYGTRKIKFKYTIWITKKLMKAFRKAKNFKR